MAVYRFSAGIIKRSAGRSVTAGAAYRAGERIHDQRTGLDFDYRRRSGVLYTEILTPNNAPDWMRDRAQLWNAVEQGEKRKDAQLAREIQLSLPHELNDWQRAELVRDFVRGQFVSKGMVADVAIHGPERNGDSRNHHAHVLLTLRVAAAEGLSKKKPREWNDRKQLEEWREQWAIYQNRALEKAGSKERVDHRSYEEQGIDKEPEPKLGPNASEMEKRGKASERGDMRREVWERNMLREELRKQVELLDKAIEREQEKQAAREAERQQSQQDQYRQAAGQKEEAGRSREEQARKKQERQKQQERDQAERKKAYEKGRFEQWANRKRAELQSQQHDGLIEIDRRHDRQRQNLDKELSEFYGPGMAEAKQTLADISARRRSGRIKRGLNRLTGQARRDKIAELAARQSLKDIQDRIAERHGALDTAQNAHKDALLDAHSKQLLRLEERIENAYERRERQGWIETRPWEKKEQQRERDKGANDNREGLERERTRGWECAAPEF